MSAPRVDYRRVYWLAPQNATEEEWLELCRLAYAERRTVGFSADDAGIGDLSDKTAVIYNLPVADEAAYRAFYDTHYPGTSLEFRQLEEVDAPPPDLPPAGGGRLTTRVGLHASADPDPLSDEELAEFAALKPGVIKVLSAHPRESILRLAAAHPGVKWIVRLFLDFGGRVVSPKEFYDWTIDDLERTLAALAEHGVATADIIIELHNEPNLAAEGMWSNWKSGAEFGVWLSALMDLYRQRPDPLRLAFPGLSPGGDVAGVRYDMKRFITEAYPWASLCNAICLHEYWSDDYPIEPPGLAAYYRDLFFLLPPYELYVSEASRNDRPARHAPQKYAEEYADYLRAVNKYGVAGVTFFVASATNPEFEPETWIGKGIAAALRAELEA